MEYGTKAWMGSYVDQHPGEEVVVVHYPTNKPKGRYGCALLDRVQTPEAPEVSEPPKVDFSQEREALGIENRISDPDFEDSWEFFVDTILSGDEAQAIQETAKSTYSNKRAYVTNAVKAHKRRNS